MKQLLVAAALVLAACAPVPRTQDGGLQPGDLLFYSDTAGMGAAVRATTGRYTHVAIVESVGDTVWIIDATQRRGVSRRPFRRRPNSQTPNSSLETPNSGRPYPDVYRLNIPFDTADVLRRARSSIGQPYDNAFLPDNGALYCSELVHECYRDADGEPMFHSRPMNWRDTNGDIPGYWLDHFSSLGQPVPEGIPGTNPTDMAAEPILKRLKDL